jgi:hypothetical protein
VVGGPKERSSGSEEGVVSNHDPYSDQQAAWAFGASRSMKNREQLVGSLISRAQTRHFHGSYAEQ